MSSNWWWVSSLSQVTFDNVTTTYTVTIQEGDDEYFRNEYSVSFEATLDDSNSLTIRVTDKEGLHEER